MTDLQETWGFHCQRIIVAIDSDDDIATSSNEMMNALCRSLLKMTTAKRLEVIVDTFQEHLFRGGVYLWFKKQNAQQSVCLVKFWRRRRDSNPGFRF